jgi:predicted short-subunit dehydrogenase-like oxidoreductase (DUF2520 family)
METRGSQIQSLNVIGCGRVGQTLLRLWHLQRAFKVQGILTNSLASAEVACTSIGTGQPTSSLNTMRAAAVWMVAVPDGQVASVAQQMAAQMKHSPAATVFHCSGALDVGALAPLAALGWQTASAHCILSFASLSAALEQFPGTPCALEGDAGVCAVLREAFTAIGAQCFDVASQDKLLYHAAAVFATNFLPVLQATAESLWQSTGVPPALIPGLRTALLRNAVANITANGPRGALTGPAARGDTAAIARQALAVAQWDGPAGAAYQALSALAVRLAKS